MSNCQYSILCNKCEMARIMTRAWEHCDSYNKSSIWVSHIIFPISSRNKGKLFKYIIIINSMKLIITNTLISYIGMYIYIGTIDKWHSSCFVSKDFSKTGLHWNKIIEWVWLRRMGRALKLSVSLILRICKWVILIVFHWKLPTRHGYIWKLN